MTNPLPTESLSKLDYELLADFRYQPDDFLDSAKKSRKPMELLRLQYLLLQIKGYPGREWATIAELAERLQAHHHGVVALTSRCEKAALVARRPGRDDGRCVEEYLQPKGEELLRNWPYCTGIIWSICSTFWKIPTENMLKRFR